MMKTISIISVAVLAVFSLVSCDIETSDNGDFDGYWHLERVDTLANGSSADFSEKRVFWGVQYKLISVRDIDRDGGHGYYMRFSQTADSIVMHTPYKDNWHQDNGDDGGDHPIYDNSLLAPYGINAIEEHFFKERLSGGRMVLRSRMLRLHFRKF